MSDEEKFEHPPIVKPRLVDIPEIPQPKLTRRLDEETLKTIYELANKIVNLKKKPLLIIFYPEIDETSMEDEDADDIRKEFEDNNFIWNKKQLTELDVIIHTYGGSPASAYLMVQAIYDFTKRMNVLVPYFSWSAGTLFALGGSQVRFGAQAIISPIDIHTRFRNPQKQRIELINLDYFLDFSANCREKIENILEDVMEDTGTKRQLFTKIDEVLLTKLIEQEGAMNIGGLFRARVWTGVYAEALLMDYMFKSDPDKIEKTQEIIERILYKCPSHSFKIDFHIAKKMGIFAEEMEAQESELTKQLIDYLRNKQEIICRYKEKGAYFPFIKLFM